MEMCAQHIHCFLSSTETDAAAEGAAIGLNIGVKCVQVDWSSSNYSVKANFMIAVTEAWAQRNAWVPSGTFGWDQVNQSRN